MAKYKRTEAVQVDPNKIAPNKKVKFKRNILIKFIIHANIGGYKAGTIIYILCDKRTKIPKERFWRNRLRDSEKDNCIELYKEPKKENEYKKDNEPKKENNEGKN